MARVAIVGAGITGLALAYRLREKRPDIDLALFEAASRAGGNIGTIREDGFQFDTGPNGFLDNKPFAMQLCRDLGLGDELVPGSESSRRHRFLFLNGKLQALPSGPLSLLKTPLLSFRGKVALIGELFRARGADEKDESVAEFFRRRIGNEATQVFIDALVTGIHGGDPELLSMRAAFPRIRQMEQEHGSVIRGFLKAAELRKREAKSRGEAYRPQQMWSFRQGLGRLPEMLFEHLGNILACNRAVSRIERSGDLYRLHFADGRVEVADTLVLSCPAYRQAEILAPFDRELATELAGIAYTAIAVVSVVYRQQDVTGAPAGFGYIAPQRQRRDVLGVQWCSSIFPERAPPGFVNWRALCGGWHRRDILDWPDERLAQAVDDELAAALGVRASPVRRRITRWRRAIPQYFVGHQKRVERIETLAARHPGLILTGNAFHGVAINDCIEQAEKIAARISSNR